MGVHSAQSTVFVFQYPESNLGMRIVILVPLFSIVLALPEGRRLRPEEHWRPAQPIDINKYKPMPRLVGDHKANGFDSAWEEEINRINRVAVAMQHQATYYTIQQKISNQRWSVEERVHQKVIRFMEE